MFTHAKNNAFCSSGAAIPATRVSRQVLTLRTFTSNWQPSRSRLRGHDFNNNSQRRPPPICKCEREPSVVMKLSLLLPFVGRPCERDSNGEGRGLWCRAGRTLLFLKIEMPGRNVRWCCVRVGWRYQPPLRCGRTDPSTKFSKF